jgi:hypothetical protein
MRKLIVVMLAYGAVAIWSVCSFAQSADPRNTAEPREQETFCYEGDGPAECVPTSDRQYDKCANLAAERGWQREAGRGYESFIYQCLTGKVPE